MAAYPSSPDYASSVFPMRETAPRFDVAESGAVHGVIVASEDAYEIRVFYDHIDATDVSTILSFYDSNRTAKDITITPVDGNGYTVAFRKRPDVDVVNAVYRNVTVTLIGNRT